MKKACVLLLVVGCGPAVPETSGGETSGGSTGSTGAAEASSVGEASTSAASTEVGTSSVPGTSSGSSGSVDGSDSSSSTGASFIPTDPDAPCDPFLQNCPEGEKCIAYADRSSAWDTTGCFPVAPDPAEPGEPCSMEESPFSGIDTCDVGSMCWEVDADTLEGTCVALCTGTLQMPACEEPSATCIIANDGALNVCLSTCDPLLQNCRAGHTCNAVGPDFICLGEEVPDPVPEGGACEFLNECVPGTTCVSAVLYGPSCRSSNCCSAYCDTTDPDCPNPAHVCVGLDDPPLGLEHLGLCQLSP